MLNELTNAKLKIHEGKETQNMCTAIDEIREEAELQGEQKGRSEERRYLIKRILRSGRSVEETAELLGVSQQEVQEIKEMKEI